VVQWCSSAETHRAFAQRFSSAMAPWLLQKPTILPLSTTMLLFKAFMSLTRYISVVVVIVIIVIL